MDDVLRNILCTHLRPVDDAAVTLAYLLRTSPYDINRSKTLLLNDTVPLKKYQ